MYNLKRIRILGNVLVFFGILAFGIELLCDQQYLSFGKMLGAGFVCGFGGLSAIVLGAGIAEWARIQLLQKPQSIPINLGKHKTKTVS